MSTKKQGYRIQDTGYKNRASCILYHKSGIVHRASCIMNQAGFTLVELLITMVVFVLVIAAASQIFTGLLTQFKQQSKIAETNIEGVVGLEMLRQDLDHAGYGLPWTYSGTVPGYTEAASAPASGYNDTDTTPPRAVLSGNNTGTNGSDYLVIKSVNVARNAPSRKSTRLISTDPYVRTWTPADENLEGTDRVIVIRGGAGASLRELVTSGTFYTTYGVNGANLTPPWRPSDATDNRIVYGVDANTNPRMPFNRADYYISIPATNMPLRCATGTGVFYKATVNHADGELSELPLLDCVADMQVVFGRDTDGDGDVDVYSDNFFDPAFNPGLNAGQIRDELIEARVYILAHEGQRDVNYTYPDATVSLPAVPDPGAGAGSVFDFAAVGIANWENYRWKVYTIVVKPENLRRE